jgi:hypothetical protein
MWSIDIHLPVPGNIILFVHVGWAANVTRQNVLMVDSHSFLYKPVTWGAQLPAGGSIDYGLPFFHHHVGLRLFQPTISTSTSTQGEQTKNDFTHGGNYHDQQYAKPFEEKRWPLRWMWLSYGNRIGFRLQHTDNYRISDIVAFGSCGYEEGANGHSERNASDIPAAICTNNVCIHSSESFRK